MLYSSWRDILLYRMLIVTIVMRMASRPTASITPAAIKRPLEDSPLSCDVFEISFRGGLLKFPSSRHSFMSCVVTFLMAQMWPHQHVRLQNPGRLSYLVMWFMEYYIRWSRTFFVCHRVILVVRSECVLTPCHFRQHFFHAVHGHVGHAIGRRKMIKSFPLCCSAGICAAQV